MISVLLVSHSNYAIGLKQSAEMIMGKQEDLDTISFKEGETVDALKGKILSKIKELDTGKGILVMVDLLGASPYNASLICSHESNTSNDIKILTGMNLPMVIEALSDRTQPKCTLNDLYPKVLKSGINGIHEALSFIEENTK